MEGQLGLTQQPEEFDMPDRVKIEIHGKRLSKEQLGTVPVVDKQTGKWSSEETVALKLAEA